MLIIKKPSPRESILSDPFVFAFVDPPSLLPYHHTDPDPDPHHTRTDTDTHTPWLADRPLAH